MASEGHQPQRGNVWAGSRICEDSDSDSDWDAPSCPSPPASRASSLRSVASPHVAVVARETSASSVQRAMRSARRSSPALTKPELGLQSPLSRLNDMGLLNGKVEENKAAVPRTLPLSFHPQRANKANMAITYSHNTDSKDGASNFRNRATVLGKDVSLPPNRTAKLSKRATPAPATSPKLPHVATRRGTGQLPFVALCDMQHLQCNILISTQTPYKGKKQSVGTFRCICGRTWRSNFSFAGHGQMCHTCQRVVAPKHQFPLSSRSVPAQFPLKPCRADAFPPR